MKTCWTLMLLVMLIWSCGKDSENKSVNRSFLELIVLGNVQDAGSPHIGCTKNCCKDLFDQPDNERMVTSIGIIDHSTGNTYLVEASPDIARQLKMLKKAAKSITEVPEAVFVSHAHIGHYTGLMYFGREAMGAKSVQVYAKSRMCEFLSSNGPWDQLLGLHNIELLGIPEDGHIEISEHLSIQVFVVPHRDEYSETIGYIIKGPEKCALFIPDIDKWSNWNWSIDSLVQEVDYAFLDGTFFDSNELANRDLSEIPHPFVIETMELFEQLDITQKSKIHFIHFNHTNPLLNIDSEQSKMVEDKGFNISRLNHQFYL